MAKQSRFLRRFLPIRAFDHRIDYIRNVVSEQIVSTQVGGRSFIKNRPYERKASGLNAEPLCFFCYVFPDFHFFETSTQPPSRLQTRVRVV